MDPFSQIPNRKPSSMALYSGIGSLWPGSARTSSFLVRIVFVPAMAFVHLVAFTIAYRQNKALIGDTGITPARHVLKQAMERGQAKRDRRLQWRHEQASTWKNKPLQYGRQRFMAWLDTFSWFVRFREVWWDRCDARDRPLPTVVWLARNPCDKQGMNQWLDGIALTGMGLSLTVLALGAANVPLVLGLWMCQRSLMSMGGLWYGYGWEPQLAELSFHALFLVPLISLQAVPSVPMSPWVQWTLQWYLFRIMMGAGLIKLRSGDVKWKNLTTMQYFYETQPIPNPLTKYFHQMPKVWHRCETVMNHFIELVAPWLLLLPPSGVLQSLGMAGRGPLLLQTLRRIGGLIQLTFQCILITSGNLSFLNWLTMVPAILCLDDAVVAPLFGGLDHARGAVAAAAAAAARTHAPVTPVVRRLVSAAFVTLILQLTIPVVRNLCSQHQIMNGSFDKLRLVNTYGAFGVVEEERTELVISACNGVDLNDWREYQLPAKPGNPYQTPKFISPYHYRLDWQLWIAACMRRVESSPWIHVLLLKLLQQDPQVLKLFDHDPFANEPIPPKYIRIEKYKYQFHKTGVHPEDSTTRNADDDDSNDNQIGRPPYWDRHVIGRFYPRQGIATVDSLKEEIAKAGLPLD